ncbi:hypothetical protein, conserved [Babesia ovata]|uniref:Extracellular matrix-binding ebh n=1 Tax=Babesia ovata TaxID=189622 RepID=A0A2H6K793_9APIC|nr:uncharacterized protein BOVATA_003480 [Babesia ovata]GBE58855.1 hypothetical protein, conserved [Babesia ovata]
MVRQPKKLTGCPENLRESIDWLIQVKNGNGDNKGLEKLAEALKKLIGDAIRNSSESLENRRKELEDVVKSNPTKNNDLEEIDARRISLGQLAGQLGGFIGGGQEVKDAILYGLHSNVTQLEKLLNASCGGKGCCGTDKITLNTYNESLKKYLGVEPLTSENLDKMLPDGILKGLIDCLRLLKGKIQQKIESLKNDIEKLKDAGQSPKNASQIDKLNKDVQSHNASMKSLDTLSELCGYADKIHNNHVNENPSKNLLDNLCTGLEKFLGYEKGNYTGEGIVYSDLDRLCDGVMAFLHGVLSGVRDDGVEAPW